MAQIFQNDNSQRAETNRFWRMAQYSDALSPETDEIQEKTLLMLESFLPTISDSIRVRGQYTVGFANSRRILFAIILIDLNCLI